MLHKKVISLVEEKNLDSEKQAELLPFSFPNNENLNNLAGRAIYLYNGNKRSFANLLEPIKIVVNENYTHLPKELLHIKKKIIDSVLITCGRILLNKEIQSVEQLIEEELSMLRLIITKKLDSDMKGKSFYWSAGSLFVLGYLNRNALFSLLNNIEAIDSSMNLLKILIKFGAENPWSIGFIAAIPLSLLVSTLMIIIEFVSRNDLSKEVEKFTRKYKSEEHFEQALKIIKKIFPEEEQEYQIKKAIKIGLNRSLKRYRNKLKNFYQIDDILHRVKFDENGYYKNKNYYKIISKLFTGEPILENKRRIQTLLKKSRKNTEKNKNEVERLIKILERNMPLTISLQYNYPFKLIWDIQLLLMLLTNKAKIQKKTN